LLFGFLSRLLFGRVSDTIKTDKLIIATLKKRLVNFFTNNFTNHMLEWFKKMFMSKKQEEAGAAAPINAPEAPEAPAAPEAPTVSEPTEAPEASEEAASEELK
jgi:hypothetical protein